MWNPIWLSAKHSKEFKTAKQAWLLQEGLGHSFSQQLSEGKFQALPEPSSIQLKEKVREKNSEVQLGTNIKSINNNI